jgi:conjugative relaxase-like TrwC/TraI family protein
MLTISKPLSGPVAVEYYENEYADPAEEGHDEEMTREGEWVGRLAADWDLRGAVGSANFALLCDGRHPLSGEQLVRHVPPKSYANFYGEPVTTLGHRAGYDATFSAPKSVSLTALVGGDRRVSASHRTAAATAFNILEEYAQARGRPAETTGRLVSARFEHALARPDRALKYAAPQLHTHLLVFNVTAREDGATRALQPFELYRAQRLATAVYRASLAHSLRGLGYEVTRDARTGAPEVAGFTREYLEASSPRRAEVTRGAEEMRARLAQVGASIRRGAGLLHAAAHAGRAGKNFDPALMRERHLEMDTRFGGQARLAVARALERGPSLVTDEQASRAAAAEAVAATLAEAVAGGTRSDARRLLADALGRDPGAAPFEAVRRVFDERVARGDFGAVLSERAAAGRVRPQKAARAEPEHIKAILDEGRPSQSIQAARVSGAAAGQGRREAASARLTAAGLKARLEEMRARGLVTEEAGAGERRRAVAARYCEEAGRALVVSPAATEREELNRLVRSELRERGRLADDEVVLRVYVEPEGGGGAVPRAEDFTPGEDVVRFGRASKAYGVGAGDYGRVVATTDRGRDTVTTIALAGGREITYRPDKLLSARRYREAELRLAEGDRVRFGAPLAKHGVPAGALGTVAAIGDRALTVRTDSGRAVALATEAPHHLDYGYAAPQPPASGPPLDLLLYNAEAREAVSPHALRALAATLSRGGRETLVFTDSFDGLCAAVAGRAAPEMNTERSAGETIPAAAERGADYEGGKNARARRGPEHGLEISI